jgi:hypothetical protein
MDEPDEGTLWLEVAHALGILQAVDLKLVNNSI